jgi:hypothetical protein
VTTKTRPTQAELAAKVMRIIASGRLDNCLSQIVQAVNARRHVQRDIEVAANLAELQIGDKVVVVGNLKPKYMLGTTGVIVKKPAQWGGRDRPDNLYVQVQGSKGRFRGQEIISIPANCLEKEE